jgi:hypothetical protein
MPDPTQDNRSAAELFKQWRKLEEVRRAFTKNGLVSADATPAQVLEAMRKLIPADLFSTTPQ